LYKTAKREIVEQTKKSVQKRKQRSSELPKSEANMGLSDIKKERTAKGRTSTNTQRPQKRSAKEINDTTKHETPTKEDTEKT
jgi:hypothetical protein